ncbi:hypothetical protein [Bacillus thuringiensis]|nr:hypothetical protein [Bacillus thuringiensis]
MNTTNKKYTPIGKTVLYGKEFIVVEEVTQDNTRGISGSEKINIKLDIF